jgi:hypothetical protein
MVNILAFSSSVSITTGIVRERSLRFEQPFSAFSAYLCDLYVVLNPSIFDAEITEVRRDEVKTPPRLLS